jgi:hypothetical protein
MERAQSKMKFLRFGKTSRLIALWLTEIINQKEKYIHNIPARAGFAT